MTTSTLRQVLTLFEDAREPISVNGIAQRLNVSPAQVESMLQHWVRKGRLRESTGGKDCGACGRHGSCPFVIDLPRSYELASENDPLSVSLTCQRCDCN